MIVDGKIVRNRMKTFKIGELSAVTRPAQAPALMTTIKNDQEQATMKTIEQLTAENATLVAELTTLKSVLAKAGKEALLTDAQRVRYNQLVATSPAEATLWLDKSHEQREIVLEEIRKADVVVYTCVATGEEIRKSAGAAAVAFAKQLDQLTATNKDLAEKAENAEYSKQAQEILGNLPRTLAHKVALIKALRKGISDEKMLGEILETLKAANDAFEGQAVENGTAEGGIATAKTAEQEYEALVAKYMADNKATRNQAVLAISDSPEMHKIYNKMITEN